MNTNHYIEDRNRIIYENAQVIRKKIFKDCISLSPRCGFIGAGKRALFLEVFKEKILLCNPRNLGDFSSKLVAMLIEKHNMEYTD